MGLWKKIYLHSSHRCDVLCFSAMQLCSLAFIPAFLLTIDWGRWLAAFLVFEFGILIYLIFVKDAGVIKSLILMQDAAKEKWIYGALLLVYLAMLGRFSAMYVADTAYKIVWHIHDVLQLLQII